MAAVFFLTMDNTRAQNCHCPPFLGNAQLSKEYSSKEPKYEETSLGTAGTFICRYGKHATGARHRVTVSVWWIKELRSHFNCNIFNTAQYRYHSKSANKIVTAFCEVDGEADLYQLGKSLGENFIHQVEPFAALCPGASPTEIQTDTVNLTRTKILYDGKIYYTFLEKEQMYEGVPIDVYYYELYGQDGQQMQQDGKLLFNRFVRIPSSDHPDQSLAKWTHVYWIYAGGRWEARSTANVKVQLLQ